MNTTEQIESKVNEYYVAIEKYVRTSYYPTKTDAKANWSLEKLAELELRVEALELQNRVI